MLNKKFFFVLAILWTIIIVYLSLATIKTDFSESLKIANKDKIVHFTFYFLFVLFWMLSIDNKEFRKKNALRTVLTAIGFGILMELFQGAFTETRTSDIFDVLANSIGSVAGLIATKLYLKNSKSKKISH